MTKDVVFLVGTKFSLRLAIFLILELSMQILEKIFFEKLVLLEVKFCGLSDKKMYGQKK